MALDFTLELSFDAHLIRCAGLENNRLVVIQLKDVIAALGDATDTLTGGYLSHFSTHYTPLHATANRIRAEIGRFVVDVPDDTIHQLSWKHSLRADLLRNRGLSTNEFYGDGASSGDLTNMIKSDYVTAKVTIDLLSGSYDDAGWQKSLADLRVSRQGGALQNALQKAYDVCGRLEQALLEGGFLGQRAMGVIKGQWNPDRPAFGRLWTRGNQVPGANTRVRVAGQRNAKGHFKKRSRGSRW